MELAMKNVIEHVFNNWTALQLAVEHSMAGPNSHEAAVSMLEYMVPFCINEANKIDDISEALEDLMDQEFDTICEDGSIEEIATILFRFLEIIKSGDLTLYNLEYSKLPVAKDWLLKSQAQIKKESTQLPIQEQPGASGTYDQPMEEENEQAEQNGNNSKEDSEWTEVKSRRKR